MEPIQEQENEGMLEVSADNLGWIWEELPAEKRREALQTLALLLVKGVQEGANHEQSA